MTVTSKSLVGETAHALLQALLLDIAAGRPVELRRSLEKDAVSLETNYRNQGTAYLTKILPSLGKAIYLSFATGYLEIPSGFKRKPGASVPAFLSGLLETSYTAEGLLRESLDVPSLTEAIQICFLAYKLNDPQSELDWVPALEKWYDTEAELGTLVFDYTDTGIQLAREVVRDVLGRFDPVNILPRHGPGAVATGEVGHEKWTFRRRFAALDRMYPAHEYFYANIRHLSDHLDDYVNFDESAIPCTKMCAVPKDSRGPRLISTEPLELMWIQKGLQNALTSCIEQHYLTSGHVCFTDQSVNGRLALEASASWVDDSKTDWCTLDMSDASDRVHKDLVRVIFSAVPVGSHTLWDYLEACRTPRTRALDGRVVELQKFAPMGSAICFPVEALIFYSLGIAAIQVESGLTRQEASKHIYVYGDDIILSPQYVDCVLGAFPKYGLRFNHGKCYLHGPFRESCGVDALAGHVVTPLKLKEALPWDKQEASAESLVSFCEFASGLYSRCYYRAAETAWKLLEGYTGRLPVTPLRVSVSYLSRKTRFPRLFTPNRLRYAKTTQSYQHRAVLVRSRNDETDRLNGWTRVLKHLVTGSADTKRPIASRTIRKWVDL